MAQTINDIQITILQQVKTAGTLPALKILTENEQNILGNVNSTSKVGVLRGMVYVVAVAIWSLQKLMDLFRSEINKLVAETRPFTEDWYVRTALSYQDGYDLLDNGGYPVPQTVAEKEAVEVSQVIDKAAVEQTVRSGVGSLRVKVATLQGEKLVPVSGTVLAGFQEYIEQMGAAGIYVQATTGPADDLKLSYKIYFNPLVLDNQGKRLDGTDDSPVLKAIKAYLKSVKFNGRLDLSRLTDAIQAVEGVESPFLVSAASKFAGYNYTSTAENAGPITALRIADAGYFELDETPGSGSNFEFVPY